MDEGMNTEQLSEKAEGISSSVREAGREAREVGQRKIEEWRSVGEEQMDRLTEYVKEKPLSCTLGALGIGFAVGFLLSRR